MLARGIMISRGLPYDSLRRQLVVVGVVVGVVVAVGVAVGEFINHHSVASIRQVCHTEVMKHPEGIKSLIATFLRWQREREDEEEPLKHIEGIVAGDSDDN